MNKPKHVFVLMLENHSFDNIFAMSGIQGIIAATENNYNNYSDQEYHVKKGAPAGMTTDPGHEFLDVLEQLTGAKTYVPGNYPSINNEGFAQNYATSTTEPPHQAPAGQNIDDIMKCFDTQNQLPVLYTLATEFAICDHWFSSLPGPTWPNRFFLHGGTSSGLDGSPTDEDYAKFAFEGFEYAHGSIFDKLGMDNCRLYHHEYGPIEGRIPQVNSIKGVHFDAQNNFDDFETDLQGDYPYQYTFIEPSYGDIYNTYEGGSSQHPMDDTLEGERLIKRTYEALRNSPLWEESLLIITYDEHGGFYDSVSPGDAIQPGDGNTEYSQYNFDFSKYGVRVPAVVVSPYIQKNTVSHNTFDHTSVIATLNHLFGFGVITLRDRAANNVLELLTLDQARTDCPLTLPSPVSSISEKKSDSFVDKDKLDALPLSNSGNHIGFLHIAMKMDFEMQPDNPAAKEEIISKVSAIRTRGQAREYVKDVAQRAFSK